MKDGRGVREPVSWGDFDARFVNELADWIGENRVLEVFAGNGLLAAKLAARGVSVVSTSLFSGHDGHDWGMHYPVVEIEASAAVRRFGPEADVLLMSWPVASEAAMRATALWGADRPIVFIGEVTRLELGSMGLGGCASDLFFEVTDEVAAFGAYSPRNMLERAAVRKLDLAKLGEWLKRREEGMSEDQVMSP